MGALAVTALAAGVWMARSRMNPSDAPASSSVPLSASASVSPPGSSGPLPSSVPRGEFGAQTTSGTVALGNLDSQINSYRAQAKRLKGSLLMVAPLIDLLLTRTQFIGSYDDFTEALSLATAAVAAEPDNPKAHLMHASVLGAVHRFDDAMASLTQAKKLGGDVAQKVETIQLARGEQLKTVRDARQARAKKTPNYGTLTALAAAQAALGEYEAADRTFLQALAAYNSVSPMPVAWIAFQRGVMWAEQAGRPDLAKALYQSAVERLPSYVVANVHLAEIEAEEGDVKSAIARLERIRKTTIDPEPTGYLAELLMKTRPDAAKRLAETAKTRYDDLLEKFPEAFADHGSEFFCGAAGNDPQRGLKLALANLKVRKNDRAYAVAIDAALAAGRNKQACELADQAGTDRPNVPLGESQREARKTGCR